MRILVVSDVTGYMRGGVPAATRKLLDGMAARGHRVGFVGDIPVTDNTSVEHFAMTFPAGSMFQAEVRRAIDAFKPDFVHVMSMSSRGVFALIPLLRHVAWLLTCHSIPPNERKFMGWHENETLHYAARNARFLLNTAAWVVLFRRRDVPHLVVHSSAVAATALWYGIARKKLSVISLGCDNVGRERASLDLQRPEAPFIVTTGGIAHTKGYHDAIVAIAEVRKTHPGVRYQIIGEVRDDSYIAYLKALISQHRLEANVSLTPSLPDAEKNRALEAADLYLQPSHEEGFCLAYIEAALQVPRLVGADTGAIKLISAEDAGALVVATKNPGQLAQAIGALLSRPLPSDTLQKRFERLRRTFAWTGYLEQHEAVYERLRQLGPTGRPA